MGKIAKLISGGSKRLSSRPIPTNSLRALREAKKWTHDTAAEKMGVSRGQFIKLERGERRLNETTAALAARAFGVSKAAVLGEPIHSDDVTRPDRDQTAEIPEFDIRAGASYAGGLAQEELHTDDSGHLITTDAVRATWAMPEPFIRQELGARPNRVHIVTVRGDSMIPALYDGDRAVIDLDDTDLSAGGIFALLDDNASLIIKQVELVRNGGQRGRIRCTSRNESYTPFELSIEETPVKIIGRVACRITKL